jgi:hypothetical protein
MHHHVQANANHGLHGGHSSGVADAAAAIISESGSSLPGVCAGHLQPTPKFWVRAPEVDVVSRSHTGKSSNSRQGPAR